MPASVSRPPFPSGLRLLNWILSGWTALVFVFLYVPIAVLVVYSFNQSRLNVVWTGFSLEWYRRLWQHAPLLRAAENSLVIAAITTALVRMADGLELTINTADLPVGARSVLVSVRPEKIFISKRRVHAANVFIARIEEEIFQGAMDHLVLVTENGTRLHALAANESAMQKAFHEGDRVYCGLHLDDIVTVQADGQDAAAVPDQPPSTGA